MAVAGDVLEENHVAQLEVVGAAVAQPDCGPPLHDGHPLRLRRVVEGAGVSGRVLLRLGLSEAQALQQLEVC